MLAKVRERAREEQQQRHEEQKRQKILEEQQKQRHREKCITEAGVRDYDGLCVIGVSFRWAKFCSETARVCQNMSEFCMSLKSVLKVAEKLQLKKRQKKEEEQRLKLELKEIATKRQFLAANAEQACGNSNQQAQRWQH